MNSMINSIKNKIDFAVVLIVTNANPNGDPLNGNRPRETKGGFGEMSDVCLKRKIRNRFIDMGEKVFVQSDDKNMDGYKSLSERAKENKALQAALKDNKDDREKYAKAACEEWLDVRTFGQVFAFKEKEKKSGGGVSVGVRGPVTIRPAISADIIDIETLQITKSVNSEPDEKRSSDTMGSKSRVPFALYSFFGSINCQLAQKTGFSDKDAEVLKEALCTLLVNDTSAARPEGSMEVCRVYWWVHNCPLGQYSSAKVHRLLHIEKKPDVEMPRSYSDYNVYVDKLEGLEPEVFDLYDAR